MQHSTTFALALALTSPITIASAQGPPPPGGGGPIPPVPPVLFPLENPLTEAKRVLGKALFFEEQLSSSNTMSCATCHLPGVGGGDPRFGVDTGQFPGPGDDVLGSPGMVTTDGNGDFAFHSMFGLDPQVTGRNAQTTIMAQFSPLGFWDGRAGNQFVDPETGAVVIPQGGALESQAVGPILSTVEMAATGRTWGDVTKKLALSRPLALATDLPPDLASAVASAGDYPTLFQNAFGSSEINASRIAMAIATYERTLVADQTPFDDFIAGNPGALTPGQAAGFNTISQTTCVVCHPPPLFTDGNFHNIGLRPPAEDEGRFLVTGVQADRGRFKTPSLRNVGLRDRYMHTGQLGAIGDVIDFYTPGGPGAPQFPQNQSPLVQQINIPPQAIPAVIDFLENALTDPRAELETFPFDRPTLASERLAAELVELGPGHALQGQVMPRWIQVAPAVVGDVGFQLGLRDTAPGAIGVLGLSLGVAPSGLQLGDAAHYHDPASLVAVQGAPTQLAPDGRGFATIDLPIPTSPALIGLHLTSQWIVLDPFQVGQYASTSGLRWQMF